MSDAAAPEVPNPVDKVMLDEYGHPIGQLVVNMGGKEAPVPVADTLVEAAQDAAAEDAASELPGVAPGEIALYYPGYDDPDKRDKARAMFLHGDYDVSRIATAVLVPERTVLMWVANNHWAEARRRELVAKDELSRLDLAETRIRKRNSVFHEQLDQAERIRRKSVKDIEDEKVAIKSGAEAWAAAAKTEQTILGLSEAGKVASADGKEDGDGSGGGGSGGPKAPLVAVVVGGGLVPIRRPQ